jgi:steroid delta-isomerase-like uncharacterized protein
LSNKATAKRFFDEVINQGKFELIDELVSPDFVEHDEFPGVGEGREGVKQFFTMFKAAFPDIKFTLNDLLEEGDKIVAHAMVTGTHKGEFLDIPPTGKSIELRSIDIVRFGSDGKVVEHWGVMDTGALMQQLGVAPG